MSTILWCSTCQTETDHRPTDTAALRCVRCRGKKSNRASRRSVLRGCLGALAFLVGMASGLVRADEKKPAPEKKTEGDKVREKTEKGAPSGGVRPPGNK